WPSSYYVVWSLNPGFRLPTGCSVPHEILYWNPGIWALKRGPGARLLGKLYELTFPLMRGLYRAAYGSARVSTLVQSCDMAVFTGGGYLNSFHELPTFDLFASLLAPGQRLTLLGQTLGPFSRPGHRRIADSLFSRADKILLRERYSEAELSGHPGKAVPSCD